MIISCGILQDAIFHILIYQYFNNLYIGTTLIPALQLDRNCIAVESQGHLLLPTQTAIIPKLSGENKVGNEEAANENASVENDTSAEHEHE